MEDLNKNEKGSVIVEFAALLPVYSLIIMGLFYFGAASMAGNDATRSAIYAAWIPGVQSENDMPHKKYASAGTILPGSGVDLVTFEDTEDENMYPENKIDYYLVEESHNPVRVVEFVNGQFVIREENRVSGIGRYINRHNLREEVDEVSMVMQGWMNRTNTEVSYEVNLPYEGLEPITITRSHEAITPLFVDRGTHEGHGEGPTEFSEEVVDLLFGEELPEPWPQGELQSYWEAN